MATDWGKRAERRIEATGTENITVTQERGKDTSQAKQLSK